MSKVAVVEKADKKVAATSEKDKTVIKPEVLEMSELISASLTMDKKTGKCSVPDNLYVSLLPEGITEDVVRTLQKHNGTVVAAAAHAVGEAAIPVMKKDKELDNVTLEMKTVDKDAIGVSFDRSRQVPSRDENNKPNGTRTKFGSTSVEVISYNAKNRGQLKAVKELLAEQAHKAFGK